ncbi:MAG: hypothetical protein Q4C11_03525 [Clostridium sp.]|nr:hypothetical protein [Clostridium sp.]CCZ18012.1 putative uncharacterized protein [Clostridium sp. CAG:780]
MLENKTDDNIMYAELSEILKMMEPEEVNKIPKKLLEVIEKEKSNTYIPNYDSKIELNSQSIKKETLAMLALLYINYWCEDENEKKEYLKLIEKNEQKYQQQIREKTDIKYITRTQKIEKNNVPEQELAVVKNKSFIKNVIEKIKSFLKKH